MYKVPLVNLALLHDRIASDVQTGFERVLKNTDFILGSAVTDFECHFASYCGVREAVGVANGTDALELALRAAGIGPGDDVMIPANTYVATAEAVIRAGARLVLADCSHDFLIDPTDVERRITPRLRAVIAVHLYGQPAAVESIRAVVGREVLMIEDAAQSQGARRHGLRAGCLGDVAATSFYPGKNLGAYGDAGAIMTDSERYAGRVRRLRNHGGTERYEHIEVGMNSRLDSLQAVVLSAKLPHLDNWNEERRVAAGYYDQLLASAPRIVTPRVAEGNEHVFHLYVVRVPDRDRVVAHMNAAGIGAAVHYPSPVHLVPAFRAFGWAVGSFPTAEKLAGEILSLPLFPGITRDQQEFVVDTLRSVVEA